MKTEKTRVVFRVWPNGDVIALFPQIADSYDGRTCSSYEHIGQHSAADTFCVVRQTRLAKPKGYRELAKELKGFGYKLVVGKKCTARDREIRQNMAKQFT